MITDVTETFIYKDGKNIEMPIFETDHTGNPAFDLKTAREIYICPTSREKGIPDIEYFDSYLHVSNSGEIIPFSKYELTDRGDYIFEETTNKRKIRKNARGENEQYQLKIPPFYVKKIKLPQDKWLIEQLLYCTRNASVEMVEGISTAPFEKLFFIYDPSYEQQRKKEFIKLRDRAYDHVRSLNSLKQLQVVHLILCNNKNFEYLSDTDLQIEIAEYAKKNPQLYIETIIDNPNFELQALLQLAMVNKLIQIGENGEFLMLNEGGIKPIPLGLSEMSAILYLRENAQIKNVLIKKTGFEQYVQIKGNSVQRADDSDKLLMFAEQLREAQEQIKMMQQTKNMSLPIREIQSPVLEVASIQEKSIPNKKTKKEPQLVY